MKAGDKIQIGRNLVAGRNGERHSFIEGQVFRVSDRTSYEIANMEARPVPLISLDYLNSRPKIKELFHIVESKQD